MQGLLHRSFSHHLALLEGHVRHAGQLLGVVRVRPLKPLNLPIVIINMVKIIMIAMPRFVPQFSVTLAACLLFILGAFKSAAITPPVRKIKHIWGR